MIPKSGHRFSDKIMLKKLELSERDFLHQVVRSFLQDQVRTLARRQYVFAQVDEIDPLPDRGRSLHGPLVVELRIAMEVGLGIAEGGLAQREEAIDVPLVQPLLLGVDVDGEVEKVRHVRDRLAILWRMAGLQYIETFDDQDV